MTIATCNRFEMPTPGSRLWGKVLFDPDADAQGETDAGGESGGGTKQKDVPYRDAEKLIRERDTAKAISRSVLEELGLEVEFVEDGAGKRKPQVKGLDRIKSLLGSDEADREEKLRKSGKWEERKSELQNEHTVKVQKITQTYDKKLTGRDAIIADLAVVNPLRSALSAEGAYDDAEGDESGMYSDLVTLLKPKLRTEIEEDDETGAAKLVVSVLGDDGKPLLDGKGDRVSIRQYVKSFLDKRPQYRKANFRPGPTGGRATYGERGRGTPSTLEHGQSAAAAFFGQPLAH